MQELIELRPTKGDLDYRVGGSIHDTERLSTIDPVVARASKMIDFVTAISWAVTVVMPLRVASRLAVLRSTFA